MLFASALFILGMPATSWASAPVIEWSRIFGGSGSDIARSIQQTGDGGFIVAGSTNSNDGDVSGNRGGWDGWIVRLDAAGDIIWQRSLGGSGGDSFNSVQQTTDGGFIVAGQSNSNDGDVSENPGYTSGWVVKLDSNGEIEWQRTFGGPRDDAISGIQQTADGGYIFIGTISSNFELELEVGRPNIFTRFIAWLSGSTEMMRVSDVLSSNVWITKLDSSGVIEWQKTFGYPGLRLQHIGRAIQQTTDGGYIAAAMVLNFESDVIALDAWVIRLDAAGEIVWERMLGGSGWDAAYTIKRTADGGYIFAGSSRSADGGLPENRAYRGSWIVKLDSSGEIEWQKSLGGSFYSVQQTTDGGYILAGNLPSNDSNVPDGRRYPDGWIVKLDADGAIEWQKTLGGSGRDGFTSVQQTLGSGYILAGNTSLGDGDVSFWVVKLRYE